VDFFIKAYIQGQHQSIIYVAKFLISLETLTRIAFKDDSKIILKISLKKTWML
jgi:hypothetical protein